MLMDAKYKAVKQSRLGRLASLPAKDGPPENSPAPGSQKMDAFPLSLQNVDFFCAVKVGITPCASITPRT